MASRLHRFGSVFTLCLVGFLFACSDANKAGSNAPAMASAAPPAAARAGDKMRVHYIDVDQGNAALVEFKCAAILIDAGGESAASTARLITYLDDFFARRTDLNRSLSAIYITHTHVDHNRSLQEVVERFNVSNYIHNGVYDGSGDDNAVWMRDHANDNGRKIAKRAVTHQDIAKSADRTGITDSVIDPVNCPGADPKIRVLHGPYRTNPGWTTESFEDGNNKGIVVRIDYGTSSFLFLGDLETEALEEMVNFYAGTNTLNADVFLASHHGSYNGTTASLMSALSPQMGVISMGTPARHAHWTAWAYGHPRADAVNLMVPAIKRSRSAPKDVLVATAVEKFSKVRMAKALYATGWDGTVIIEADQSGHLAVNDNALTSMAVNDNELVSMAAK